jgi:enoyl-CoA hydratase
MEADVLFEQRRNLGLITLNRPKALNALTRAMCNLIHPQLTIWANDPTIEAVVIRGAGDRAFCAGGDVVGLYNAGKAGSEDWEGFFFDEYRLNHAIGTYPKPYIAMLDGIFMGGGVGLSVHGSHRILTEKSLFAMPETGIGLIPDVGGTHALARLPGETGVYLALTGARLKAADALMVGLGTHFVSSDRLDALIEALSAKSIHGRDSVDAVLENFAADPGPAPLAEFRGRIDQHFAKDSVEAIFDSLASGADWARSQHDTLLKLSPTSMKLSLKAVRAGRLLDLAGCLIQEFRIVSAIKASHDFYEGVRAQLVDKDRNPQWQPKTLGDVSDALVDRHFQPPAWGDLTFA